MAMTVSYYFSQTFFGLYVWFWNNGGKSEHHHHSLLVEKNGRLQMTSQAQEVEFFCANSETFLLNLAKLDDWNSLL
jgi:hypothetical protein